MMQLLCGGGPMWGYVVVPLCGGAIMWWCHYVVVSYVVLPLCGGVTMCGKPMWW